MLRGEDDCRQDDGQPKHAARPAEEPANNRNCTIEEFVLVPDSYAHCERVQSTLPPARSVYLGGTTNELGGIWRAFGLKKIGGIELSQQSDHVVLAGCVLPQTSHGLFP